jgi:DNA-binding NarL/FixJ family response regulator
MTALSVWAHRRRRKINVRGPTKSAQPRGSPGPVFRDKMPSTRHQSVASPSLLWRPGARNQTWLGHLALCASRMRLNFRECGGVLVVKKARILLADDHAMICAGFQKLLEPEFEVVGSVGDGLALLKAAAELRPDLVLVDVGMPVLNGLDAGRELKKSFPAIRIIFLTMNHDTDVASEALRIGASGYLLKTSQGDELRQAVNNALKGISYVTPQMDRALAQSFIRDPNSLNRRKQLTDRQRQILQMLSEGRSMKEIASILEISTRTVRFHKYRIMEEQSIGTTAELIQFAIKNGIIFPQ